MLIDLIDLIYIKVVLALCLKYYLITQAVDVAAKMKTNLKNL